VAIVHLEGPEQPWLSRTEAIAWLGISKREFYRLMRTDPPVFHQGRRRGDSPRLWYSREDCACMRAYVMNQALYDATREKAVKRKKSGVSTG
jgi:hypothetical protein